MSCRPSYLGRHTAAFGGEDEMQRLDMTTAKTVGLAWDCSMPRLRSLSMSSGKTKKPSESSPHGEPHAMKAKTTTNESRTDWKRLEEMSDADIDFSDIPELDADFFRNAKVRMPRAKKAISLRLDQDVLTWFRKQGRGYQTRMNAVLRTYMQAHKS